MLNLFRHLLLQDLAQNENSIKKRENLLHYVKKLQDIKSTKILLRNLRDNKEVYKIYIKLKVIKLFVLMFKYV